MPSFDACCRSPLMRPAYLPLPDGAVRAEGTLGDLTEKTLRHAALCRGELECALAARLAGREPPAPQRSLASFLPGDPAGFTRAARAAYVRACLSRDKEQWLSLLCAVRDFSDALADESQDELVSFGADALRLFLALYRRTGQRFLLKAIALVRSLLPDAAGYFHSFPVVRPFEPGQEEASGSENESYRRRVQALSTGRITADALAQTALLAQYSGSAREGAAAKAGLASLDRYHGLPTGLFTADPYLAGRDPAQATELEAMCAFVETLCDLLQTGGDLTAADRLELILENALPRALQGDQAQRMQPATVLPGSDSFARYPAAAQKTCAYTPVTAESAGSLIRALYALRQCVWMADAKDGLSLLLPMDSVCVARVDGKAVRVRASCKADTLLLTVETAVPTAFSLCVRVPGYAEGATVTAFDKTEEIAAGALYRVRREFQNGDTLLFHLPQTVRVESGYRGGLTLLAGARLFVLPLENPDDPWRYALDGTELPQSARYDAQTDTLRVPAYTAEWPVKLGFPAPPPQSPARGEAALLTLVPYARARARIALFPRAGR